MQINSAIVIWFLALIFNIMDCQHFTSSIWCSRNSWFTLPGILVKRETLDIYQLHSHTQELFIYFHRLLQGFRPGDKSGEKFVSLSMYEKKKTEKRIIKNEQVLNIKGEQEKSNLKGTRQKPGWLGEETNLPGLFAATGLGSQDDYYWWPNFRYSRDVNFIWVERKNWRPMTSSYLSYSFCQYFFYSSLFLETIFETRYLLFIYGIHHKLICWCHSIHVIVYGHWRQTLVELVDHSYHRVACCLDRKKKNEKSYLWSHVHSMER